MDSLIKPIINDREGLTPNEVEWAFILSEFAKPFDYGEVKFREQSRGNFAAYIDSREVQQRLDEVVGSNWETNFRELATRNTQITPRTPTVAQEKHKAEWYAANKPDEYVPPLIERGNYGKVKNKSDELFDYQDIYTTGVHCDLLVFGKARSDVGTPANTEPVKSAYSDSLKRAAVQWGIGRYLYSLGFFTSQNPELPEDALPSEAVNFAKLIKDERELISGLLRENKNPDAERALELVNSRYSPLVSLLQKRRILLNLKEITTELKRGS